ncbi:hypothetical protein C5167_024075 [Papaver somniferum]|uniref:Uncharacterized protein n=1 Tax=Papaver somniferum TaxID=3469 RepID=A0A4Y7JQU2_PAPSO|nr:hypothetical protein C5167_024075 [Papaver somniferum]
MSARTDGEEAPTETLKCRSNILEYSAERRKSLRARYVYGFIFLLMNLTTSFIRDYGHNVFHNELCELARIGAGCCLGLFMSIVFYIGSAFGRDGFVPLSVQVRCLLSSGIMARTSFIFVGLLLEASLRIINAVRNTTDLETAM